MKVNFDWRRVVLLVIISAGLIFITGSYTMAAGILILLLVGDYFLMQYEARKHDKEIADATQSLMEEIRNKQKANTENDKKAQ
jgi:ABC-type transport system involved in cytochrome bd biosynthesis fused ATPase/permease subunit